MDVELLCLVNDEARRIHTQTNRIASIVRENPNIKFYYINHTSPHKEWIVYGIQGREVVAYPALFKPVKLLTYLLLTDV